MNQFDEKAMQWDENPVHYKRSLAIATELQKRIPLTQNTNAIEIGAGTAILSILLSDYVNEIILIDNSIEMLRVASKKIEEKGILNLKPLKLDLESENFNGKPANLLFSQMALHHMADVPLSLRKFYQMLEPAGYLAIADLYPEDGSFHGFEPNVHLGFDPEWLKNELEKIGFQELTYSSVFTIQKLSDTGLKEYPVFLITGKKNNV